MKECQLCKHCYTDDVATCPKDGMPTMHTIAGEPVLEGKYQLELRLGQGGMGVVYKARHAYLKTQLAIKIILPDLVGNDPQLVTRFRQEALAAAAIRHQNVVAVTDYGVIAGSIPFLVMEYVDGESLHDLLAREKKLDPEQALDLISAVCAGVGAAHHQGIVHRDLKPLNIMICNDKPSMSQAVKILDFGLAKIKSGELLGSFIQAQTTGLMGSPYYMAPEQWADDEPDSRSDIYSLGVMLYQMLAGDVPFKGSSIPAIMKKHISDPAPLFASLGVSISPQLETAVMHTLEKEKERRTPSVEAMISEVKEAIYPQAIGIHTTGSAVPVSSINILTNPPNSNVFFDNVAVGQSRDDGWITLSGIQGGNHSLRVTKEGFGDFETNVLCDGTPKQVVADLSAGAAPRPDEPTVAYSGGIGPNTPQNIVATGDHATEVQKTMVQNWDTGKQHIGVQSQPPKRSFLSPLIFAAIGVIALLGLGVLGIGGAYMAGVFGGGKAKGNTNGTNVNSSSTPGQVDPPTDTKPEMVQIPGGTFKMGREGGGDIEKPEHDENIAAFSVSKNEVTNGQFYEFMAATSYKPSSTDKFLSHWENNRPIKGEENSPVRWVSMDDVLAFIAWRSKKDSTTYRLPSEKEWEYVARSGSKSSLYPWGDKFDSKCAVVDQGSNDPKPVATASCPNSWGVYDLIGNVMEWTASEPWAYPGSPFAVQSGGEKRFMIRGGSAMYKSTGPSAVTSTFRIDTPASTRHPALGFRLAQD